MYRGDARRTRSAGVVRSLDPQSYNFVVTGE
jgi:hypothetical protein